MAPAPAGPGLAAGNFPLMLKVSWKNIAIIRFPLLGIFKSYPFLSVGTILETSPFFNGIDATEPSYHLQMSMTFPDVLFICFQEILIFSHFLHFFSGYILNSPIFSIQLTLLPAWEARVSILRHRGTVGAQPHRAGQGEVR